MVDHPSRGPLGSKPVLPTPQGASAQRGASLFQRFLAEQRRGAGGGAVYGAAPTSVPAPAAGELPLPAPDSFGGGRRYDVALAAAADCGEQDVPTWGTAAEVQGTADATGLVTAEVTAAVACDDEADAVTQTAVVRPVEAEEEARPERPPPGAPTVRPSAPRRRGPAAVPQDVLEATAQSALLMEDADGGTSFDIAIRDEIFNDLSCRITVHEGRVAAVFRVADTNMRRLLESEAGRLRANLEDRGLRVEDVRVEVG